jgi:hypothetical protein
VTTRADILGLDVAFAYYGFMNSPELLISVPHTHTANWFYRWVFSFLGREWHLRVSERVSRATLACSAWSLSIVITEIRCIVVGMRGDPDEIFTDLAALRFGFPGMSEYRNLDL